ncbi:MAG: peptidoglycan DD-metalloendopeptidase family protein [Oscillospiraceae bacterium]|nr:peptidoglycan DD-metalloendopeptidase family protein [Oscillospiraceae bacterium]
MNQKKIIRLIAVVMVALLLLSLVVSVLPIRAHAEGFSSLEEAQAARDSARERASTARNKVQALKEEQAAVIEEKMALEEQTAACIEEINLIEETISLVVAEIQDYDEKIALKEQDVLAAQQREDEQLEKYRVRIRAMEENGGYNVLSVILNADSYSSLLSAMDDYGDVMDSDVALYDQLQDARREHQRIEKEFREYKAECEQRKAEHEAVKAGLEADKASLEAEIEASEALIQDYVERIEAAEEEQRAAEAAEANAKQAVDGFLAAYYAQKAAEEAARQAAAQQAAQEAAQNGESYTPEYESSGGGGGGGGTGSYVWPFPGHSVISSPYGQRPSTGSFHSGVDIDGFQSMGAAIVAADGGTVIKAEYSGGYGNCIIIDHGGGMSTLYAHLNSMNVGVGSSVSQGQTIGGVGNSGTTYGADGIHLHFEVRVNGSTVDPLSYIGGYPHSFL